MQREMAVVAPEEVQRNFWQPLVEKMPLFGKLRPSYNFEWPTQYMVEHWETNSRIQLQRLTTNWTSLRSLQMHLVGGIKSPELAAKTRGDTDKDNMLNISVNPMTGKSVPIAKVCIKMGSDSLGVL